MTDGSHALAAVGELLAATAPSGLQRAQRDPRRRRHQGAARRVDLHRVGLLDSTHYQLYSERSLELALRRAGLKRIDAYDVMLARSDQHFPADHLGLSECTSFGALAAPHPRRRESHGITNQFVWAVTASPAAAELAPARRGRTVPERADAHPGSASAGDAGGAACAWPPRRRPDFEVLSWRTDDARGADRQSSRSSRTSLPGLRNGSGSCARPRPPLGPAEPRAARGAGPLHRDLRRRRHRAGQLGRCVRSGRVAQPWPDPPRVSLRQDVTHSEVRAIPGVRRPRQPQSVFTRSSASPSTWPLNQSPTLSWVFPRSLFLDFGLSSTSR